MVKGANVSLGALTEDAGSVVASLSWRGRSSGNPDADVSVLLLNENGKIRQDADFVFYNNREAADGSVQLLGKTSTADGSEDRISLDLAGMPADVETIVVAASREPGCRFGDLDDLRVTLSDSTGEALLGFSITDAGVESAFIFGELYRRNDEWKFRAVGQGYETGLAGLATDFGIDVDDTPDETTAGAVPDGAPEPSVLDGPEVQAEAPRVEQEPRPAVPAQAEAPEEAVPAPKRPRTAKKKVTLPEAPRNSLAEKDDWHEARLFPVPAMKSDRDREVRATSVLLSVMAQVPELGRRLTVPFGAPSGRMEVYTEVPLPHGDTPRRPDGVVRVQRAGKLWTALVETKTNGNPLKQEQVQAYTDIAAKRGYEAVITLSNDVALKGTPLVSVKTDGRRKHKVALWHLSWAEVAHHAQMLLRHDGVANPAHAWLLQELLHYLRHDNSGCHGFQNMGAAWVPVRKGIEDETLCRGDGRAVEVIESWERLVLQVCLRLEGRLGRKVAPVPYARRGADPRERRVAMADDFCDDGRLHAEIRIEGTPGATGIVADLRTGRLRSSIEVPAPEQGYPLTWAKRLVRHLSEAPADLHVETLVQGDSAGPRGTLGQLRLEPGDLLPKDGAPITGFRISLLRKNMGNTRGTAESGFIRSVDELVDRFYDDVVGPLEPRPARSRTAS
ncbi:TerD family protein [Streptomyces sp. NPDC001941]|uniref:TerD family protein n=1 Tax=Streptomyces sp. NPDC001941 TaxID=3154659 RepID=UPI003319A513